MKKYLFWVFGAAVLFMVSLVVGQDRASAPVYPILLGGCGCTFFVENATK